MDAQFILRLIVLGLFGATALLCAVAMVKETERRLWAFVPLTLVAHVFVFYAAVLLRVPLSQAALTQWSAALRVHEGALIFAGAWLFLWPARSRR